MKKTIISIFILIFSVAASEAQVKEFAHKLIDTLASEKFAGRAYVEKGDKKAAYFIASHLQKSGVLPFGESYFQEFTIPVNTFPKRMKIVLGKKELKPGVDYIVNPQSCALSGNFKLKVFNKKNYTKITAFAKKDNSKFLFVLDTIGFNNKVEAEKLMAYKNNKLNAAGIIEIYPKNLIYTPSLVQNNFVSIKLKPHAFSPKPKTISITIDAEFIPKYTTQNAAGFIAGKTDSFIVFSAHYDHVGKMGAETCFPGANDNASGTAMLLSLAYYFSKPENKPKHSIAFLFFGAEEAGILGSIYYTQNPLFPLSKIKFLTNLDMVGSGDKGIKAVNATVFKKEFSALTEINTQKKYLPKVASRGPAANSDHYFFYANEVPCFFIYTLGDYKEYHNIYDKSEKLPLSKFEELYHLLIDFTISF